MSLNNNCLGTTSGCITPQFAGVFVTWGLIPDPIVVGRYYSRLTP